MDTFSWVKGAHVLRFGGEYTRVNLDKLFPQVFNGQLFFVNGGGFTDFQKFLMGAPDFSFGGGGVATTSTAPMTSLCLRRTTGKCAAI